ncbi:hypothetical protein TUMEXPCC7403_00820 [Tumidithrix helvetica PCC 7403]
MRNILHAPSPDYRNKANKKPAIESHRCGQSRLSNYLVRDFRMVSQISLARGKFLEISLGLL